MAQFFPPDKIAHYTHVLETRITGDVDDSTISRIIFDTAEEVFERKRTTRNTWFTAACRDAREEALRATGDGRHSAFRKYKNFIKGVKRKYIRERQLMLAKELKQEPRSFWSRLHAPRSKSELSTAELVQYLQKLYHLPQFVGMPAASGSVCTFDTTEVEEAIRRLRSELMDTPPLETESEEERIRRDLERLFGPEDFELGTDSSEEFDTDAVVDFPSVTSVQPEELYSYLENLGILQLPFTTVESICAGVQDSVEDDPRFWGTWRTRRVKLVPGRKDSGRITYKTVVADLEDNSGEVWVSRLWTGDEVGPLVPFGALLEGKDGIYRAGIEVGSEGFTTPEDRSNQLIAPGVTLGTLI
ncbi:hypothetical protein R1sor_010476 [Riccia sorocarpa]|uniref:Uncharacterized protein n=1 Tax=Riccia sorocarpa TaxID=122646 RepID=A0ABD3I1Q5_9MARC